jgi:hypothetical protein
MNLDCNICKKSLPTENFHKCNSITRGYQYKCKACVSAYDKTVERMEYQKEKVKDWRESNPDKRAEQKKRHYLKYKDKIDQRAKDWYNNNKERYRGNAMLRKYGISLETLNQMRESQQYRCAICGQDEEKLLKGLVVDHCHDTGQVRKLLCPNCNVAIGMLQDDPRLLMIAAKYLKEFNG